MPAKRLIILWIFFILGCTISSAQTPYVLNVDVVDPVSLNDHCLVYPDSTGELSLESILSKTIKGYPLNEVGDLKENVTYWGVFRIKSNAGADQDLLLDLGENNFAELYIFKDSLLAHYETGELVAGSKKQLPNGRKMSTFPIKTYTGETVTFYVRVSNSLHFSPVLDPMICAPQQWWQGRRLETMLQAIFHGILGLLIIYSIIFFFMYPHRIYVYFALYAATIALYFLWFKGILHEFILPEYPGINIYLWLSEGLVQVFYIQFARHFLETWHLTPKWDKLFKWMVRLGYGFFVFEVILFIVTHNRPLVSAITNNFALLNILIGLVFLFYLYKTKNRLAIFFIYGSALFVFFSLLGVVLFQYFDFEQAIYFIQVGNILELLCFSLGLGYRVGLLQRDKRIADQRLIEELRKNDILQKKINAQLGKAIDTKDLELEHKNEELEQLVADLQSANSDLKAFAYSISHDLKTPLRGISSMATFIDQDFGNDMAPKAKEYLTILQARVKKMETLFNGILEYSKSTTTEQVKSYINLNTLLRTVDEVIDRPEGIQIAIERNLPGVYGYPTKMYQVFQNLIGNAVKFVDKANGKIEVGYMDEEDHWKFFVKDNGCGIHPREIERIFVIFKTSMSNGNEGTGVGLSIVKRIIEQHGGNIWAESKLGQGSYFYFTLPKQE
ncbi:GHKL domain-containing protein [Fulvivirga sp. M361]|uniref:ATP-binding protein n=1 Tax=Fulvivirga sp. M361 TaxID=2594266 RepID=UPI00117A4CA5|nr:ATP-binding protein [Fulvivirga sp. M361]TRX57696.1 GHKL domain-containing protein [Fulvivirga sp. M361]